MAFEDLQKAFIEADLEKLREKNAKLKSKGKGALAKSKIVVKGKKKIDAGKKLALTKGMAKSKDKAKLKELEKEKKVEEEKAIKEAEKKETQKDKDGKAKEVSNSPQSYEVATDAKTDLSLYQQKFYLPEDKNRISGLDQLEAINKLPAPEDKAPPKEEKKRPVQENAQDRFKQLRDALGGGGASGTLLAPQKTPITAEARAAKEAAAKDVGASMNAILALHSNKKS